MPANLPTKGKPATGDEATGKSSHQATGVEGDGARGQISRGTWEARSGVGEPLRGRTEPERVSEKPAVAKKSGNADGAKGL